MYINRIFFIITILSVSIFSYSQNIIPRSNSSITVADSRLQGTLNLLTPRFADTTAANLQKGIDSLGAVIYTYDTHTLWVRAYSSGKRWIEIGSGAGSATAGEGLINSGDSIHLGGLVGTPAPLFSQDRVVNTNRNGMYWANGSIPDLVDPGGIAWDFGQEVFSPFQFASRDTVNANDVDPPTAAVPWSGIYARRELYYPTGVFRTQKVFGHQFEMNWLWDDTLSLRTEEGDYNVGTSFKNVFRPYGTDRQGIRASHGTGQNNSIAYAAPAVLAVTQLENTASNYIKVDGHLSGFNSYLVMGANTADTLKAYVYYTTGAFVSPTSLIQRSYDFAPSADFASPRVDSAYGWFDTVRVKFQHFSGKTVFGPTRASAHAWASSDIFKVIGNVNITDSLMLGKAHNSGTLTGFRALIRRTSDGSVFEAEPSMFGSTLDLQAVTDAGSTTTNLITALAFHSKPSYTSNWTGALTFTGNGITANGNLVLRENSDGTGNTVTLSPLAMSSNIELFLPETANGDTLSTKAYARSVGGGGASLFPTTGTGTATGNVTGDLNTNSLTITDGTVNFGVAGASTGIFTQSGVTSGTITFQPASAAGTYTLTWPTTDGNSGEVLSTDGNGVLSWSSAAGGANVGLSNLSAVAINTSLISDADNTDDLGSSANSWKDIYSRTLKLDGSTSGTVTINSDALANAPNATTLSGAGYVPAIMFSRLTSNFTMSDVNTVQPVFSTSQDVFTLQASTTYRFRGKYYLTHGAVSHSVGMSFELGGGASLTAINYTTIAEVTVANTNTASQTMNNITVATNTAINSAGANAQETIVFEGWMMVNAGGTVTPSITFSAAPGGTPEAVAYHTWIEFWPVGTDTVTTLGNVN